MIYLIVAAILIGCAIAYKLKAKKKCSCGKCNSENCKCAENKCIDGDCTCHNVVVIDHSHVAIEVETPKVEVIETPSVVEAPKVAPKVEAPKVVKAVAKAPVKKKPAPKPAPKGGKKPGKK